MRKVLLEAGPSRRCADCLDRILILGRRHLERVLGVYRRHYNEHRPHRALQLLPPDGRDPTPVTALDDHRRRDLLGGLILATAEAQRQWTNDYSDHALLYFEVQEL